MKKINNKGFTMIELLVVIAIIGLLSTLAIVSFTGAQKSARDTQRKSDLKQYQTAIEGLANKSGGLYPGYAAATISSSNICGVNFLNLTGTTCMSDPKATDTSGVTYRYGYASNTSNGLFSATTYVLWARLEKPQLTSSPFLVICSNGKSAETTSEPSSGTCPL